ncbi:hypothetical protein TNCV_3092991 [Trichonephila clavipes]|uniref:Uncharacterized protein n=1 Tax=Trichonephila clavipes TaxID=2585209 RepID=A0A8X6S2L9_TRICX|nr:hypothetical protein TNCV_3092991 [Trichonephila clavipes]
MLPICPQYQLEQASPRYILDCFELDWEDIHNSSLLVFGLKVRNLWKLFAAYKRSMVIGVHPDERSANG